MNDSTDQERPVAPPPTPLPPPSASALRGAALPFAVAAAFVLAGLIGGLPAVWLRWHNPALLAAPLGAAAWVAAAYLVAPLHKARAAAIAFAFGAVAAWLLSGLATHSAGARLLTWLLAVAGGAAALLLGLPAVERRRWLAPVAPAFSEAHRIVHQFITQGGRTMEEKPSVRQLLKQYAWLRWLVAAAVLATTAGAASRLGRAVIDIVPPDSRGLYTRLGKYVRTLEPGLHMKVPLIDSIIHVSVRERQGYIQHVDAMTQDNVIMRISLQYTYEVKDPRRYRLEVEEPDTIIKEFVQGKLRDIVNTITMSDLMRKRLDLGQRITQDLAGRELDYGIHFKLVQVQGTYPPPEVQEAIKQSMVTEQRTVGAKEEATQKHILADAMLYEAQKQTEAAKYKIEETAKAQKESIRLLLEELSKHEALGQKYMDYLVSQELKANSKWIISGSQVPQFHMGMEKN